MWHATEWASVLSNMVSSVSKSFRPSSQDVGIHITTSACNLQGDEDQEGREETGEDYEKEEDALFEFTYDVRHNYILSSRLEGERVIRPIRFECGLDLFLQGH
jgi:hypothetical protein